MRRAVPSDEGLEDRAQDQDERDKYEKHSQHVQKRSERLALGAKGIQHAV
jgi:hypothetical protein